MRNVTRRACLLGGLTLLAGCSAGADRSASTRPAPPPASTEHREDPEAAAASDAEDDFPSEGREVAGPIRDPLGFVMPAQTSWRLVQNDVGPARFALHGVPVPVRTYTYTRIVDRVAVATTAYVFWFRTPIADGRELAARFELSWVRDTAAEDGSWVSELRRGAASRWMFATPSADGSTAIVLCGDEPLEVVGHELEDDDEEPGDEEHARALASVEDPARRICESIVRTEPRPALLPEHDSTPR